jgi:putative DNA primase/helicase
LSADALRDAGIKPRHTRLGTQRLPCPKCAAEKHRPDDDALALTIEDGAAIWYCHRCHWSGSTRGKQETAPHAANVTRLDRTGAETRAARKARLIWDAARLADVHPYLARKGIAGYGLRRIARFAYSVANMMENALIVPMRDASGEIVNLQGIGPDGTKRFLAGALTRGAFCCVGEWRRGATPERIAIGEGWATVAAFCLLYPAFRGIAALSSANLPRVARIVREKFGNTEIIICGDADVAGMQAAGEAAASVHAEIRAPGTMGVDWADLWRESQHAS